ncbi:MAG TPA: LacI family DNA-binding transcriptional regulator [Fimbriimonadaceae bacterium]|nr:LacI family DNA-binding transcriptional regulator [Fimbriimonadaceae bacterium]
MRDVAARAGVSPVVVSRVLHDRAQAIRVSEATAERVRQAAQELGYRCNVWARNFRSQQSFTIGLLHGFGFDAPYLSVGSRYFACLMDGVLQGAFDHGYSVAFCPKLLGQNPSAALSDGRFDGLVWYSAVESEAGRQLLESCQIPVVLIHSHSCTFGFRYPAVIADNDQGVGLAVDHLVNLGHRRIGMATEEAFENLEMRERAEAFGAHMARHGLEVSPEDFLLPGPGDVGIDAYFSQGAAHTAIFAFNEGLAARWMAGAHRNGLRVPEDMSFVGFDSTSFCDELSPRLTAVSQPLRSMGERAVDLLVSQMRGAVEEPLEHLFPCGLDVRGSTQSITGEEKQS